MNNEELIDRLNALQAQNIALMQIVAAVVNQAGMEVRAEYRARCAIFNAVTGPHTDADARAIERAEFGRVERTVLGDCDALSPE